MRRITLVALTALALAGCSVGSSSYLSNVPSTSSQSTVPAWQYSQVAITRDSKPLQVFSSPKSTQHRTLTHKTAYGSPRVLSVISGRRDWVLVRLPERPNGSTAWVRESDVKLYRLDDYIIVHLTSRLIDIYLNGVKRTSAIAIGSRQYPTPTGHFYVIDRVTPTTQSGYGSFALGTSAYSEVLTEFAGGNGQVGIHGTNDKDSIGRAVSHGCLRVPDNMISTLKQVQLGTPIFIKTD
jgi:lipoprotein-anchoring transpeptidase ErfK/SrfK